MDEVLFGVEGVRYVVRLSGAQTSGDLSVVECVLAPRSVGAAPHTHHGHSEHFHVGAGAVTFVTGGRTEELETVVETDGWVSVPRGMRHGFRNDTDAEAIVRFLLTPAGYEGYFRDIDELVRAGHVPDAETLARLRAAYDTDTG